MRHILILGGGFGGIKAALELNKKLSAKEASVTLIDRNNYHLFLPALYEVASAYGLKPDRYHLKLKKTVSIPYAEIFAHTRINFIQAEATKVDLQGKTVVTAGEKIIPYDHLILALGAETDTFQTPGAAEYAYKFKTIDEAIFLNQRITELFAKAARGRQALPIKFIIAGAGFNGIELAGELACCTNNIKNACKLNQGCVSIELIEGGPQILPMVLEKEKRIIRRRLEDLGVKIIENTPIREVGPNFVKMGERGEKRWADFIIWTAGVRASSFLKTISGLLLDVRGRVVVNKFLQTENYPEVWAVGDNNVFMDEATQGPVPGLAYVAVDQGQIAAENIKRSLAQKKDLKEYRPFYWIWIAPVGGKFAVAHLGKKVTLSGMVGWLFRLLVDFRYFLSILPFSQALALFDQEMEVFLKND